VATEYLPRIHGGSLIAIDVRDSDRGPVMQVSGELDITNSDLLLQAVRTLDLDGQRSVVLDLTGLTFCDASGAAAFIEASRHLRHVGGRLRITGASGLPRRVLTLTGVDEYLEVQ
jgi:anti-sigma B factor antagonist